MKSLSTHITEAFVTEANFDHMAGLSIQMPSFGQLTIIDVKDNLVIAKDTRGNVKQLAMKTVIQSNPGIDVKPKIARSRKTDDDKLIAKAKYQTMLKNAIDDAGGTEFASDIAQSMIYDKQIQDRIAKDYPAIANSIQKMTLRLQWDLEAIN